MEDAWDRASAHYLERRGGGVHAVSYGNLAPNDDELGLLGDLRGKRVLDFGCGGGHNAVACALAGASVVGIDISQVQLAAAQQLASRYGVEVTWRQGTVLQLGEWAAATFDLVLMIQVLPYMADAEAALREAGRLLQSGGKLVVSLDHPLRNCFYDGEIEEFSPYPARSYFDQGWLRWHFAPGVPMEAQARTLGAWISLIAGVGLTLEKLIEPPAPVEVCDELWPEDSPLAPLRNIPHTAILVARAAGYIKE